MIAQMVKAIVNLYNKNGVPFDWSHQLGIIVPFRRQIALVRAEIEALMKDDCADAVSLSSLMIDTVERYQGSQRDIIVYGTTITQHYELDILSNLSTTHDVLIDRKLNVALTRARKQLFIFGNELLLRNNLLYSQLIAHCQS